jgi:chromosome segregation ATPase
VESNKIADLNNVNEKLNGDIKKLLNNLNIAQTEHTKLTQEKESLLDFIDKKLAASAASDEATLKQLEEVKGSNEELEIQRSEAIKKLGEQFEQLHNMSKERDNLVITLKEKDAVLGEKLKEIQEFEKKSHDFEKKARDINEAKNELLQQLNMTKENFATLTTTLNETHSDLEKSQKRVFDLEIKMEDFDRLKGAYDEQAARLKDLERTLNRECEKSEEGYQKLKMENSKFMIENADLKIENANLRSNHERLRGEVNSLNEDLERKKKQLFTQNQELSDFGRRITDKERIIQEFRIREPLKDKVMDENYELAKTLQANLMALKEDNKKFQEKMAFLNEKMSEMTENENELISQNTGLRHLVNMSKDYLGNIRKELKRFNATFYQSGCNNIVTFGEFDVSNRSFSNDDFGMRSDELEGIYKDVTKYLELNRQEIEKLNKRYNDLKQELTKLDRRNNSRSEEKTEVSALKKDAIALERGKELLHQKLIAMEYENKSLQDELSQTKQSLLDMKNTGTSGIFFDSKTTKETATPNSHLNYNSNEGPAGELKSKEYLIRKYKNFIFNLEVLELIDEAAKANGEILLLEKQRKPPQIKGRNNLDNSPDSMRNYQTASPARSYNPSEGGGRRTHRTTAGGPQERMSATINETLEVLKAKKSSVENELYKLEMQEKKRYDSNADLEQQNFQLKNEIYRLMNELEINFSKYNENQYYSRYDKLDTAGSGLDTNVTDSVTKINSIRKENTGKQHMERYGESMLNDLAYNNKY